MIHTLLKAGAVLALSGMAFTGQSLAASPTLSADSNPRVILVEDEENKEVWQDLRPDVTPPPAAVRKEGEAPEGAMREEQKEGSSDVENEEVERDLRTEEAPPAGE